MCWWSTMTSPSTPSLIVRYPCSSGARRAVKPTPAMYSICIPACWSAQFGSDLDANTKATLAQGERIVEVLKQHNSSPVEVIHQVAILYAVTKGFLKEVPVEKISEYEAFLYETLDARYAGLLAAIRTAGKLEKETEQQLASAIAETVSAFLAAL